MKALAEKVDMFMNIHQKIINPMKHDEDIALDQVRDDPDPDCDQKDYCHILEGTTEHIMGKLQSAVKLTKLS